MRHQLGNSVDTGTEKGEGHHLSLVKDDHASGDIVEFAALGGTAGIQGLKELHRRGHHYRYVPVFCGSGHTDGVGIGLAFQIIEDIGVVFQYVLRSQYPAESLCRLFNDGGVRDNIDYPPQTMPSGVSQGKGQGCHRLSAAGGYGEGKKSGLLSLPLLKAALQNLTALAVQFTLWRKPARYVVMEHVPQMLCGKLVLCPALCLHKGLGVQKVGVHQTGVEHPGKKHSFRHSVLYKAGNVRLGQPYLLPPAVIGGQKVPLFSLYAAAQSGLLRPVPLAAAVRQTTMVTCYCKSGKGLPALPALRCTRCGVVCPWATVKPPLESSAVLSDIMGQSGQFCLRFAPKRLSKCPGQRGSSQQVG